YLHTAAWEVARQGSGDYSGCPSPFTSDSALAVPDVIKPELTKRRGCSLGGSLVRASQSRLGKAAHLERTQKLNTYMPRLRGMCIFHFVQGEVLVPDHFPSCQYMQEQSQGNYGAFRRSFNFTTKFEYCYCCGAPQDQQNNGECPAFQIYVFLARTPIDDWMVGWVNDWSWLRLLKDWIIGVGVGWMVGLMLDG
ncbi:hypothetical protein OG21DRAFT_1527781, partial [Imleria badia]